MNPPEVVLVVAMARNRVIGRAGSLPWHLPDDLRHFRELTQGGMVILGRKTYESIGRPLPKRRNVVVSRSPSYQAPGCETASSWEAALALAAPGSRAFVIGGGELYRLALPMAKRIELTLVDADVEGDTTMPEWDRDDWREVSRSMHPADERHALPFAFVTLEKMPPPA